MAPVFFVLEGKGEALHPNLGQPARRRLKQLHGIALAPDGVGQRTLECHALLGRGARGGGGEQADGQAGGQAGGGHHSGHYPAQQDENADVNSGQRARQCKQ
jgi:hypothetical protein